jgi:uncharacterized protein (DUF2236 family)
MAGSGEYYFPPGESMARRVHGERAVGLLYGQRALLIGALEPLTYTGTMLSTNSGDHPFTRLARTAQIQETVFLGTKAEADKALAAVHRLHERIKGELPEAAGPHPAGAAYSAFDPELMLWTLAVIADSGRAMYEAMARPLSESELEDLWQDYVRFGELFLLPREAMPASYREFKDWFDGRLASSAAHATEHALEMAPLVAFRQPVPLPARLNLETQNLIIKGPCPNACGRSSASAGPAPTRPPSARSPPPTAAPGRRCRARCAAAATTTSSRWSPSRRSAAAGLELPA